MLKARNLDDQTYEEIVQAAEGRLPWLCPVWTDHNAHDPGITILELMAWYKELQQYHMNQFTDELRCKLLKLAGITRRPAAPARCAVELGPEAPERLEGERLETREEIPFELAEAVPARRPVLAQIRVVQGDRSRDVGELLGDRAITFQPFAQAGGECSALHIGLSQLGEGDLRLWFEVVPPEGTPRNPFSDPEQAPRTIRWTCLGAEGTRLVRDDTHALSVSGYVVLRPEGEWPAGGDGLHWLTITLEDPGCEEEVRLSGVSAGRYSALQQETWARSHFFQAPAREDWTVRLADALARDGELAVFVRRADGWAQTDRWRAAADMSSASARKRSASRPCARSSVWKTASSSPVLSAITNCPACSWPTISLWRPASSMPPAGGTAFPIRSSRPFPAACPWSAPTFMPCPKWSATGKPA